MIYYKMYFSNMTCKVNDIDYRQQCVLVKNRTVPRAICMWLINLITIKLFEFVLFKTNATLKIFNFEVSSKGYAYNFKTKYIFEYNLVRLSTKE